jgi:hypothetical protein
VSETKNQHYVPQFLLKRFSSNKRSVSQLLIKEDKLIENSSIKAQCSEANFYDHDNVIEKSLSNTEGLISEILREIDSNRLSLLSADEFISLAFG